MTNEELKNIIARHVCNACEFGHGFDGKCDIGNDYRKCNICGETAEALILAGIRDVEEAEHWGEVLLRALINSLSLLSKIQHEVSVYIRSKIPSFEEIIDQAEKELAEEEKDD